LKPINKTKIDGDWRWKHERWVNCMKPVTCVACFPSRNNDYFRGHLAWYSFENGFFLPSLKRDKVQAMAATKQ